MRRDLRIFDEHPASVAPYCTAVIAPKYVAASAVHELSTGIDWAELLKRVHDLDALACPCGGRLKFVALILDADPRPTPSSCRPARAILESLHLPSEPPPIAAVPTTLVFV